MKTKPILMIIFLGALLPFKTFTMDSNNSLCIEKCLLQKKTEIDNNKAFYLAATNPQYDTIRTSWTDFGLNSVSQIESAKQCPLKNITIAGVTLEAHDVTNYHYQFHIHTTEITNEKVKLLQQYIQSQRDCGDNRPPVQSLNLDLCPLISTSIIDPHTGGYTENSDNEGNALQIHLILKTDARAINHTGRMDIFSPAKGSIHKYLNNLQGRETMVQYFTTKLDSVVPPQQLIIDTHTDSDAGKFNEIVVLGNHYSHFFKNAADIDILGIGLSSYWIERRRNPSPLDIEALKVLSKFIPIIYYEPKNDLLFYNKILLGYCPQNLWLEKLKSEYMNHKIYLENMEGFKTRNSIHDGHVKQLPFGGFRSLCPIQFNNCSKQYEIFVRQYNKFISCIQDETSPVNLDEIYIHLKETIVSNLELAIEAYDIGIKSSYPGNINDLDLTELDELKSELEVQLNYALLLNEILYGRKNL